MAETDKKAETPTVAVSQPGSVIAPGSASSSLNEASADTPAASVPTTETATSGTSVPQSPEQTAAPEQSVTPAATASTADTNGISWTASEFVAHEKSVGWYLALAVSALVLAAVVYLLTRDIISTIVILAGGLVFGFYGARKPRQLEYRLDDDGVTVGPKYHAYEDFRSFAVVPEGAFSSIIFMPLKRFAPLTTIYYAPEDEDKIIDLLDNRLPFEEHTHDVVDRFMRRIRF